MGTGLSGLGGARYLRRYLLKTLDNSSLELGVERSGESWSKRWFTLPGGWKCRPSAQRASSRWALGFMQACGGSSPGSCVRTSICGHQAALYETPPATLCHCHDRNRSIPSMIGQLSCYPDIMADMLVCDIGELLQADVAPQAADTAQDIIAVEKRGAMTEFKCHMILE